MLKELSLFIYTKTCEVSSASSDKQLYKKKKKGKTYNPQAETGVILVEASFPNGNEGGE
jgi:hypothetical protein